MASPKQMNFRNISKGGGGYLGVPSWKCVLFWLINTLNPEMTLLYQFHAQKSLFKDPKSATKFFGLKMTPPLEVFRKFIYFGTLTLTFENVGILGESPKTLTLRVSDWQLESYLDSICNSCNAFNPSLIQNYIGTICLTFLQFRFSSLLLESQRANA